MYDVKNVFGLIANAISGALNVVFGVYERFNAIGILFYAISIYVLYRVLLVPFLGSSGSSDKVKKARSSSDKEN